MSYVMLQFHCWLVKIGLFFPLLNCKLFEEKKEYFTIIACLMLNMYLFIKWLRNCGVIHIITKASPTKPIYHGVFYRKSADLDDEMEGKPSISWIFLNYLFSFFLFHTKSRLLPFCLMLLFSLPMCMFYTEVPWAQKISLYITIWLYLRKGERQNSLPLNQERRLEHVQIPKERFQAESSGRKEVSSFMPLFLLKSKVEIL